MGKIAKGLVDGVQHRAIQGYPLNRLVTLVIYCKATSRLHVAYVLIMPVLNQDRVCLLGLLQAKLF
jgi:hypothetical protein